MIDSDEEEALYVPLVSHSLFPLLLLPIRLQPHKKLSPNSLKEKPKIMPEHAALFLKSYNSKK